MATFYSVQSKEDATRLRAGGDPWPLEDRRANLGAGWYSWRNVNDAERYRARLANRRILGLVIIAYSIEEAELAALKSLDLSTWSDADGTAWLERHTRYGQGVPHGFDYIIRPTGLGNEHYFSAQVFHKLTETTP